LVTLELADVEIDHCVQCGGIWLDVGELEILLDDPVRARTLLDSFREAASAEQLRRCPICDRPMVKVAVGPSEPPRLIDKCRSRDGLWFDGGELQEILAGHGLDGDSRVQRLLADVFGRSGRGSSTEL
jgi:hypothetical protein